MTEAKRTTKSAQGGTNYGVAILNDAPCGETATIAATGLGRSGTTMVARVMAELGLFIGDRVTPQSSEDREIVVALKSGDLDAVGRLARSRDERFARWGFKAPALRGHMKAAEALLRAPRFVVVFRDPVAVALRNNLALDAEMVAALKQAASGNRTLAGALADLAAPVLVLSYEKSLQYPERTVAAMAAFCGLAPSADEVARIAAATVVNADPRYLGAR